LELLTQFGEALAIEGLMEKIRSKVDPVEDLKTFHQNIIKKLKSIERRKSAQVRKPPRP